MQPHSRKKRWIVIVSIAVLLHVALFYSVRPSFFSAFKKTIDADVGDGLGQPAPPRFIITIPVEIDDSPNPETEQNPVQEPRPRVAVERQPAENAATQKLDKGYEDESPSDVENLIGESPQTLPDNIGPEAVVIPPRPLEITWPDTRRLKQCLGNHVDVRIEVSSAGRILRVEADDPGQPPACVEAALRSARLIVFEPGQKDGHPVTMWTRVRIEFRKKN